MVPSYFLRLTLSTSETRVIGTEVGRWHQTPNFKMLARARWHPSFSSLPSYSLVHNLICVGSTHPVVLTNLLWYVHAAGECIAPIQHPGPSHSFDDREHRPLLTSLTLSRRLFVQTPKLFPQGFLRRGPISHSAQIRARLLHEVGIFASSLLIARND
jgi:hypothetical protein